MDQSLVAIFSNVSCGLSWGGGQSCGMTRILLV